MSNNHFDVEAFYAALDAHREAQSKTWKKVAAEAGVMASTLTRMKQGKRPDIDGLAALAKWSGLNVSNFYLNESGIRNKTETIAEITALLRADRNLSQEGLSAMEAMIKSAYNSMKKENG